MTSCARATLLSARAEAPAATPARPRKVCRRDPVWPKLRTSPSNRSESMIMPSIRCAGGHTHSGLRKPPRSHYGAGGRRSRLSKVIFRGRPATHPAMTKVVADDHNGIVHSGRKRKVRHRGAGDRGSGERRMLDCLRPRQHTPPRLTVRLSIGSDTACYPLLSPWVSRERPQRLVRGIARPAADTVPGWVTRSASRTPVLPPGSLDCRSACAPRAPDG